MNFRQRINCVKLLVMLCALGHGGLLTLLHAGPVAQQQPSQQAADYSLQFSGEAIPGLGIRITAITPGGPLTRLTDPYYPGPGTYSLKAGDILVAIDNYSTYTSEEFKRMMATLGPKGGRARLLIRDGSTGYYRSYNATAIIPSPVVELPGNGNNAGSNDDNDRGYDPKAERRIHFVICGQSGTTDSDFNQSVSVTLNGLADLIATIDNRFIGSITFVRECTAGKIRDALRDLETEPEDTIFFYYTGHGVADANGNHVFNLQPTGGKDMMRSEVEGYLSVLNVRLTLVISDSCNVYTYRTLYLSDIEQLLAYSMESAPRLEMNKFEKLLLNFAGFVSVNCVKLEQRGWGNPSIGSFYTRELVSDLKGLATNCNWRRCLDDVGRKTNEVYRRKREEMMKSPNCPTEVRMQSSMTPHEFRFDVKRDVYEFSFAPGQYAPVPARSGG